MVVILLLFYIFNYIIYYYYMMVIIYYIIYTILNLKIIFRMVVPWKVAVNLLSDYYMAASC